MSSATARDPADRSVSWASKNMIVLDASALIAILLREAGADEIGIRLLARAIFCTRRI